MNKEADKTVLHFLLDASLPCDLCENKESHIKFVSFTRQKKQQHKNKTMKILTNVTNMYINGNKCIIVTN